MFLYGKSENKLTGNIQLKYLQNKVLQGSCLDFNVNFLCLYKGNHLYQPLARSLSNELESCIN